MAELKKRKKSLNQIVNPPNAVKSSFFPSNCPINATSFRPVSSKSKLKKPALVNQTITAHYTYSNLIPLKTDLNKSNSKKAITQRDFPIEKDNSFTQNTNSIISQNKYYYFPENSHSNNVKSNQTPVTTQTQATNTKDSMNLETQQQTTNKKISKTSKNCQNLLEFSNNSAKTQLIASNSNQKNEYKTDTSSGCLDLNFSHTIVPENNDLMCQENLPMPSEEFTENTFFPQSISQENINKDTIMQEETKFPVFQHETGFEFTQQTLEHLIKKEYEYSPNCNYFKNLQKVITPYMRAILIDWMMEVCNEFTLKRETFHLAVNYVDRILSLSCNVQKNELQLIGVVSMFLASKIEEVYPPKLSDFALSADNAFTIEQIKDKEEEVLKLLKFMINPPTYYMWSNWLMSQWDLYIDHSNYAKNHQIKRKFQNTSSHFKQPKEESYALFRELMQLIDCSLLDVESLQYKPRALILSFLYLVLGKNYQQFDEVQIIEQMPFCNSNLLNKEFIFNDLFANFAFCCMGAELFELLPYIQYCSKFFGLGLNYELPNAAKINKQYVLEGHFEEFLAYQTHNSQNLDFIKKKKPVLNNKN